ncbi:hypothetical protein BCY90_15685 [Agrobacterium deltaense]|uniref:DUF6117 family protein n=1 Tax=Agrobacterium TaxID=357 RepID=UPI000745AB67|nr:MULTISPECIES: DUF6117 family protein [Agrobacterium]KVK54316.1 hypothetical protein L901_18265 [Agrobacterium sp. D14]QAB00989.1 hypothetical protein DC439_24630 [Agrobacterium tumefaciens]RKF41759.1 hypothetical protein BCY90_15685 [Agrobacterium deltaense]
MAIPDYARTNFETLLRAARDGNLALMECLDARTEEPRFVLCAVGGDGGDRVFTPFGHLAAGNPYDAYFPPDPNDASGFLTGGTAGSSEPLSATGSKGGDDENLA